MRTPAGSELRSIAVQAAAPQAPSKASSRRDGGTWSSRLAYPCDDGGEDRVGRAFTSQQETRQLRILQAEQLDECLAFGTGRGREVALQVARHQHVELAHAAPAGPAQPPGRGAGVQGLRGGKVHVRCDAQCWRSTIIFLISAIAFAGLRSFGQTEVQFMMVWQR